MRDYGIIQADESKLLQWIKKYASYAECIGSALFYGFCSTSMAFLNKAVVSSFNFDFPLFIMACQMILCIVLLDILRLLGVITISKYSFKLGISLMWPSLFYALNSFSALHALAGMSIPMYAAVKRCAPIVTLFLSVILLQKKCPSWNLILSVILITVGCISASFGDLKFDMTAYKYGIMSVLSQSLYLTLAQKSLQNIPSLAVLYICSYNTILIFVILSFHFEYQEITKFYGFSNSAFLLCFALQVTVGVLLNYSLFLCTEKNSALTTSLVGVAKSILQTVVGIFTFGGMEFNVMNTFGLTLNLFGGILYTYVKYQEKIVHEKLECDIKV